MTEQHPRADTKGSNNSNTEKPTTLAEDCKKDKVQLWGSLRTVQVTSRSPPGHVQVTVSVETDFSWRMSIPKVKTKIKKNSRLIGINSSSKFPLVQVRCSKVSRCTKFLNIVDFWTLTMEEKSIKKAKAHNIIKAKGVGGCFFFCF